MFSYGMKASSKENRSNIKEFYELMHINPYMNFMANWNYESFIQKSLDHNLNKPLQFIIEYLLNKTTDTLFKSVLIQDLPQLLI